MFSLDLLKYKWYYAVLIAIAFQLLILYLPKQAIIPKEALEAIERAKTDACKREFEEFVSRLNQKDWYPKKLERSCHKDSNTKNRIQPIGCLTNSSKELVIIPHTFLNSTTCLDLCFDYGHSFGGYHQSSKKCYCGDSDFKLGNHGEDHSCNPDELQWFYIQKGIFSAKSSKSSDFKGVTESQTTKIKVAFLLSLNGRPTIQVLRILKNIYSPEHVYYIHVDNRQQHLFEDLLPLESKYNNIILARLRFNTVWGGPSLLRMIIDSIKQLSRHDWDYLINLSETDFPIKNLKELETYLTSNKGSIFLRTHNLKGYDFVKKQGLEWNFYQCEDRVWRINKRRLPGGIIYSGGSDWFALPRDFALYIEAHKTNQSSLVKPLLQVFNYTLLPAESFFHVIALNSDFCDRFVDNNLRITNWQRKQSCKCQHKDVVDWCGCSPLVYKWLDWTKLKQTLSNKSLFFSRKFDPTISSSIISAVEQQLVLDKSNVSKSSYDTRYWLDVHPIYEQKRALFQFGQLGLKKLIAWDAKHLHQYSNNSTQIYFNHDKFVGLTFSYCAETSCIQFLTRRHPDVHKDGFNEECLKFSDKLLQVIEVNHGFDTNERLFRNYLPLDERSEIAVYHEWLVQNSDPNSEVKANTTERITFSWIGPTGSIQLIQNIKLKMTNKPTRLSLAHRMNMKKHLEPGIWTLSIAINQVTCLNYPFLVFSSHLNDFKIDIEQFNKFYLVTDSCYTGHGDDVAKIYSQRAIKHCDNFEWTQSAKESYIKMYGLV